MLWKCCTRYARKFGKCSSGHRSGKGQFSFQSKGNAKECSNCCTIALISYTSKVMLKIVQARLQQYMNWEFPDVQAGFRKGRGTRDQISNICWIIEKAIEFQKNIYFCFIDYAKAFDCVDHNKLWKILKVMGLPDHLTCFLRNLYAGQEGTVRTGHGTTDWFQIGKGICQGCILSVQFSSVTRLCPTLCNPMNRSTPGHLVQHQLPEPTQTHVHWVSDASNHLILCHPLLLLPSIFPNIRVFSNESALCIR